MKLTTTTIIAAAALAVVTGGAGVSVAAETAPQKPDATKPTLEFAFEEHVTLGKGIPVGKTAMGTRNIVPITGGTFEGPNIHGTIMPGGWDWQLIRADGCVHIKADYMIKTDDGAIINVLNQGIICRPKEGAPPAGPAHTVPVFEPPLGKYEWLGQSTFVGTLEPATDGGPLTAIKIRFYRVQ
jgi:hypothetical protein